MLIIKSDFSPHAAQDLQEADNVKALNVLILFSGLSENYVNGYKEYNEKAAIAFDLELTESTENNVESKYRAANLAAKPYLDKAEKILIDHGICIKNKLHKSDNSDFFSHIATTLYIDYTDSTPVASIERAVIDIESKLYEDNSFGFQA